MVIRTDRIGDMALTTPALGDLAAPFRKAEITILAPPAPLELLREHPAVDHLVPLRDSRLPPALVVRVDVVIDFTPDEDLRGALLARASHVRLRVGCGAAGRQACFSLRGARAEKRAHIVDLNRDLLDSLGVPATSVQPALYVSADERGTAQAGMASRGAAAPRVAVHPGGHYPSQRWSPERFAELITSLTERCGAACVVVAGPDEQDLARRICEATPDALPAGALSIRSLMGLIAPRGFFVRHKSGAVHIAGGPGGAARFVLGARRPTRFA